MDERMRFFVCPSRGAHAARRREVALLRARDLQVRYGSIIAVRGLSLDLEPGEITAIVGPNGAGKTSLLAALAGLIPSRGAVEIEGRRIDGLPAEKRARAGLALVQDGRRLFGGLTVEQNLIVASIAVKGRRAAASAVARVLAEFPMLGDRAGQRADTLSGGEGQLLMIARALVGAPRVLLADEPFEELDAQAAALVHAALAQIAAQGAAVAVTSPDPVPGAGAIHMLHGALLEPSK